MAQRLSLILSLSKDAGVPIPISRNPLRDAACAWHWSANAPDEALAMLFMVIETFRNQDAKSVYRRFRDKGRQMPDGLAFVGSWIAADLGRCFQIMETDDVTLLQRWVAEWSDLVDFEIVPVTSGKSTAEALAVQL